MRALQGLSMILLLPFAALSGAVLADAARGGLHKALSDPRRRELAVSHLRMIAYGHGRQHNVSIIDVKVDIDAYVKALEIRILAHDQALTQEGMAEELEQAFIARGEEEGARRARELKLKFAKQRELLEELAESLAHHKAWVRE